MMEPFEEEVRVAMEEIGMKELKTNPGRVLARVARGESLLLTQRGMPVARIVPPSPSREELAGVVASLAALREEIVARGGGLTTEEILAARHEGHPW